MKILLRPRYSLASKRERESLSLCKCRCNLFFFICLSWPSSRRADLFFVCFFLHLSNDVIDWIAIHLGTRIPAHGSMESINLLDNYHTISCYFERLRPLYKYTNVWYMEYGCLYKSTYTRNGHTLINAQETCVMCIHSYVFPNGFVFQRSPRRKKKKNWFKSLTRKVNENSSGNKKLPPSNKWLYMCTRTGPAAAATAATPPETTSELTFFVRYDAMFVAGTIWISTKPS